MESPRNRSCRERKTVDGSLELLHLLLVLYPEPLLLVHNHKTQIVEYHILLQNPVGPYYDICPAALKVLDNCLLLFRWNKTGKEPDLHREVLEPFLEIIVVLLCQNCGRTQESSLLSSGHSLEHGPHGNLGLAKSDIAADKPVHRVGSLHICLDLFYTTELVAGLVIWEGSLKLHLHVGIGGEGISFCILPP